MCKYLLNHRRVFDTSNYLDCATAFFASCNIDIEYSLEALCPGHRGVTVCRLAVARLTVFLTLVAFTAFSRCYQGTVLAVWRENTMESNKASRQRQLSEIVEGYELFREFDLRELRLIEPLRAMRVLNYSAWLARRWGDPAFPVSFPWFNTPRYWSEHILELKELLSSLQEAPLTMPD